VAIEATTSSEAPGRPLSICHVYKDYPPVMGGIEHHLQALAQAQAAAGHRVTVLVTGEGLRSGQAMESGVQVIRAGRLAKLASTPISPALAWTLGRQKPDVFHLHSPYPVGEAAWLLGRRRPMVLTYHSDVVRQRRLGKLWSPFLHAILGRADRILATSPNYVESSPHLRRFRQRVSVVPLGIDPARFAGLDRQAARGQLGAGPNLVFVGRLRYYKGLGSLIRALPLMPQSPRLLVVGSGPMGEAWRALAAELGVGARIEWLGDVSEGDLPQVYAAGDLFVLPAVARSEAFGIVLMEAMASGLPCISTELGTGTSWVNQEGRTGRVVPPDNPAALAEAINALLADPALRQRMGQAARERIETELSEAHMVRRVEAIYREVTGSGERP
jgi:rhamnosyl/mannosyltransferase